VSINSLGFHNTCCCTGCLQRSAPDFIVKHSIGSKEYRYGLIIDEYQSHNTGISNISYTTQQIRISVRDGGLVPEQTGRLTVGRKITLILT
jgi:hypothetical protein